MNRLAARATSLWAHTGFQKYFKNTSWILLGRLGSMIISFTATLYVARMLGPNNYGELSYALSFVALFGFIASLGVDTVVFRDLVRFPNKRNSILGTAIPIRLIAGTIAAIIATSISYGLLQHDVSSFLVLILSGSFILNSFQLINFDFQARTDTKLPSIATIIIALILNLLKVLVIALHKGVIYLAIVYLFESVLYMSFYIYIYIHAHRESISRWQFDSAYARTLLLDSTPLIALTAFSMVYARVDQVLIRHLIDAHAVGVYDAAVRVAEVWTFIPGILLTSLAPAIVNAKLVSEDLYNRRLGKLALLFFSIAVVIALGVSLTASYIMAILFGSAFVEGVIVLKIYVWAFVGTSLGIVITQYLTTENFRRIVAVIAFFPMILNIVLNLMWIPRYGIEGSAYATLISYSLTPFMLFFFSSTRKRVRDVYRSLIPS
jgi:O-antigen/teichoic acid export membrane protein